MSMDARAWAESQPKALCRWDRTVLWQLADAHNLNTGQCNPGITTLARRLGISKKRVGQVLQRLERLNLIERRRQFRKSTAYRLNIGAVVAEGSIRQLGRWPACERPNGSERGVRSTSGEWIGTRGQVCLGRMDRNTGAATFRTPGSGDEPYETGVAPAADRPAVCGKRAARRTAGASSVIVEAARASEAHLASQTATSEREPQVVHEAQHEVSRGAAPVLPVDGQTAVQRNRTATIVSIHLRHGRLFDAQRAEREGARIEGRDARTIPTAGNPEAVYEVGIEARLTPLQAIWMACVAEIDLAAAEHRQPSGWSLEFVELASPLSLRGPDDLASALTKLGVEFPPRFRKFAWFTPVAPQAQCLEAFHA